MDKLQKEFKDELLILGENGTDSYEKTKKILKRLKRVMDIDLASDAETDWKTLGKIFQQGGYKPWIYKGRLIAITGKEEVNSKNIKRVLNGESIEMINTKFDSLYSFPDLQLHKNIIKKWSTNNSRSTLSEELPGFRRDRGNTYPGKNDKGLYGIRYINYSLAMLYSMVTDLGYIRDLEVDDKELANKKYCYELIEYGYDGKGYKESESIAKKRIKSNLDEVFNLNVKKVKRLRKTYVLRGLDNVDKKLRSKGGEKEYDVTAFYFTYKNVPFENFVKKLQYCLPSREAPFFVNEVEFEGNVDVDIDVTTTDVKKMRKALKKYGLDLSIEEREHEVVILTDK